MSTDELSAALARLHDTYTDRVNQAVGQGRTDLAAALADEFSTRSLNLILSGGPTRDPT